MAAVALALLPLAWTSTARAQGFSLNRFEPSERRSDWFANESLDLRGNLRPAFGVVADGMYRPLVLYNANGDIVSSIVRNRITIHPGASINLWDRVRVGLSLPIIAFQDGKSGQYQGVVYTPPSTPAVGDLRLGLDVRLAGEYGDAATLAIGAQVHFPTGKTSDYTSDGQVRFNPRLMVAGDVGIFVYSARAGVQIRNDGTSIANTTLGHELMFGAAAGIRVADKKLVIGPEVYGSTILSDAFARASTPVEGILGAHWQLGDWKLGGGGGLGLTRGFGSPVGHWMASVEWAPDYDKKPEDRDHDGVPDNEDACPDTPGVRTNDPKTNGCPPPPPDRDGDGIWDKNDACPDVAGVTSDDPTKNGCPPDRDGDGVIDSEDACPDVKGLRTTDPKTNGCPDPDRDKDGILNEADACPDEPGKADPDPKKNGCPKAFVQAGQIKILDQVKFKTGSAAILPGKDSEDILTAVMDVLSKHPEIKGIRVEGHTDNVGAAAMNKKLSADRAKSVATWLTKHGFPADRITSAGFGMEKPIDDNKTPEGRKNNRRVEFHIEDAPAATTDKPADKPAAKPTEKAGDKPATKPAQTPAKK
ncbi:MAG: OmpA family protein [Polyangiaceae bacterium]